MLLFELVVALLLVGALFALWADRIGVPYPALLALAGAAVAFLPGVPAVQLDPELALTLFVAPTLLDAAYDASPRDLRRNLASVLSLAVALVIVTIASVAWILRLTIPDVGWAAAITLGAIVAPPDASAATAVLSKLRPPHRLLVILEGESLFNDASALLVYRMALGAAMTGAFSGWSLEREVIVARVVTARAALDVLEDTGADTRAAMTLRSDYEMRLQSHTADPALGIDERLAELQRRAVAAQRVALTDLRARHDVGDTAFHMIEEEIDLLELTAEARARRSADQPA